MRRATHGIRFAVSVLVLSIAASVSGSGTGAIIIDHHCVDVSAVPDSYVSLASSLRILVRHASVGQGIIWGLDCLAGDHPTNSACSCFPAGKYDRGNWVFEARMGNWRDKVDDLVTQTASRLDDFGVFMMKFCYIDALGDSHPDWEYFRSRMEKLEADYPGKTFVWWTIPLTRDGQSGTDVFNAQIRSYVAVNGKVLFDIADIECHEADGTKLVNASGNEIISANYTKEIHAGHLNPTGRVRVASAFWHLMARVAGWDPSPCIDYGGSPADFDHSGTVDANDLLSLTRVWLSEDLPRPEDIDRDGRIDLADFVQLADDWRADTVFIREPIELSLGKRASWPPGHEGYDPDLPGYHIVGDIASVALRVATDRLPCVLILAIQTSPGMPPMLENFTLVGPQVKLSGEPFNPDGGLTYFKKVGSDDWEDVPAVETDAYFKFEICDDEVRVTFLPRAVELLRDDCTISWIDWYR